jgi:glutathione S-transferase
MLELKLIYFKMRALAETPQLMLRYADLPYSYEMAWDYFGAPWDQIKPTFLYTQLPALQINNDKIIVQSGSIVRHLAKITNLMPNDDILAAEVDALFETSQELFIPLNPTINFATGRVFEEKKVKVLKFLESRLTILERELSKYDDGPFFFGNQVHYADFGVFHHVDLARFLDEKLLTPYPLMMQFMTNIESLKGVSEYLNIRPELIGVGTDPKLIISGEAKSTGIIDN